MTEMTHAKVKIALFDNLTVALRAGIFCQRGQTSTFEAKNIPGSRKYPLGLTLKFHSATLSELLTFA